MLGLESAPRWQRVALGLIVGAAVVVAGAAALLALSSGGSTSSPAAASNLVTATPTSAPSPVPSPSPTPIRHAAPLDGAPISDEEWEARKDLLPIAVMVDNSPSAYPQSGLDRADLVYEAFVEGGITRFMAVFWAHDTDFVEPVRSARTPFVNWVSELDALYAHAGGATTENDANAIGQIAEWGIKDLNAFAPASSNAYYRDSARYSPYNLVAGTSWLREAAAKLGYAGPAASEPWLFKADDPGSSAGAPAGGIEVSFRDRRVPWQLVQWHWDRATDSYLRFQAGGPHVDGQTGEQLRFKNVVVMRVPWQVVDESGHVLLDQFGQGPATVFVDGRAIEGTWRKKDRTGRTRFYDGSGAEIAFNRGPIFIEVVGPESLVTVAAEASGLPEMPPYEPPPQAVPEATSDGGETATPTQEATPLPSATPGGSPSPHPSASVSPSASSTPAPSATTAAPTTVVPTPRAAASATAH